MATCSLTRFGFGASIGSSSGRYLCLGRSAQDRLLQYCLRRSCLGSIRNRYWVSDVITGRRRAGAVRSDVAASLCPPPEVFCGEPADCEMAPAACRGAPDYRASVVFQPLGADALHCTGCLAFVSRVAPDSPPQQSEAAELHRRLWNLRRHLLAECQLDELVGISPAIARVREQIELASHGQVRVVVHGPSGSGREHVARLLHRRAAARALWPIGSSVLSAIGCRVVADNDYQPCATVVVGGGRATGSRCEQRPPTLLLLEVDQLSDEAQTELAGFLALPDFELYSIATSGDFVGRVGRRGTVSRRSCSRA